MQVLGNPELIRLMRSKLRARTLLTTGGISAVVCLGAFIVALNFKNMLPPGMLTGNIYSGLFYAICWMQLLPLTFYAVQLSAQNLTLEKERATYDFQRLVAMGPWNLTLGKLLGSPIEAYWMGLVACPFAMVASFLGGISTVDAVQSQIVVFLYGLFAASLGLFCSSVSEKSNQSTGMVFGLGTLLYIFTSVWSKTSLWSALSPYGAMYGADQINPVFYKLFWVQVNVFMAFVVLTSLLIATLFILTVRRVADPDLSPLSRKQGLALFAAVQVILISSRDWLPGLAHQELAEFHGVNLAILTLLAFGLCPSGEMLRGRLSRGKSGDQLAILREPHNPLQDSPGVATMGLLCGIYAALALFLTQYYDYWELQSIPAIVITALVPFAVNLLVTYIQLYVNAGGAKIAFVLLAISQAIPPLAVIALVLLRDATSFVGTVVVSPTSYLWHFSAHPGAAFFSTIDSSYFDLWALPAIIAAIVVALVLLVNARFSFLIDLNRVMQEKERQLEERAVLSSPREVLTARAMATEPAPAPQPAQAQPE